MNDCTACPLHKTCLNTNIPGRGPDNAEIMLVCEAPGGKEDLLGSVLIGKSGQLLDSLLQDAGISLHTVFKTNAIRCRPPRNRKPLPGEIEQCRSHLKAEIHRVKPKAIVAMGDLALQALCKKSGVGDKRGKDLRLHGTFEYDVPVWVTYSPKLILMQPLSRATIINDLRRTKDGTQGPEEIEWEEWAGKLPGGSVISWDLETSYHQDKKNTVIQASIYDGRVALVARDTKGLAEMLTALQEHAASGGRIVGHNSWSADCIWAEEFLHETIRLRGNTPSHTS
jgi:uracil-DNA glycosylase